MTHKDWHDGFSADRDLPFIAKLQQMIDPDKPIPLIGWNAYVVIKKMADALDKMESDAKKYSEIIAEQNAEIETLKENC